MKIAHLTSIHSTFDIRIFHKQCKSLNKYGYDVTLIVKSDVNKEVEGIKITSLKEQTNRLKRFFFSSWEVYKKSIQSNACICHFHDPELIPIAILLRLKGRKIIYDVHEDLPCQILSKDWVHPWLRYPVSWIAAFTEWVGSRFFFSGIVPATPKIASRFPASKTVLVQNYPIVNELSQTVTMAWSEKKDQVAYIGGIAKIRGAIESIQAFELLEPNNSRLLLAGEFTSESLHEECRLLSGWVHVSYHSWLSREEVKNNLAKSKAGLVLFHPCPNHIDAQPNKMYEYMSASIPVIASNFPLWREVIEGANCGLLVDPLKPDEIAKAIDWMFEHPQEAEMMGKNGREAVINKYNWSKEEKKLVDLYRRLLLK